MKLEITNQIDFSGNVPAPFILLLTPRSNDSQQVLYNQLSISPTVDTFEYTDVFGNICHRLISPLGSFSIKNKSVVVTSPDIYKNHAAMALPVERLPFETLTYLLPSRYCESDQFINFGYELTDAHHTGYNKVEAIRRWIYQNIKYEYGSSNSSSSAIGVNTTRKGVCRDFAHLGIALCRAINIPARMVSGYLHQLKPMDMHAWFEAYIDNTWYAFDATQAVQTGGRVVVGYGKDSGDIAFSTYFGAVNLLSMTVSVQAVC
jgi:transglutaminase-like putative cysteine protease